MKLKDLANTLGLALRGEDRGDAAITGVNTLDKAGPGEISFLANPRYADLLPGCRATAVIVDEAHADQAATALVSPTPYLAFARAVQLFATPQGCMRGISPLACLHAEASVDPSCTVYPFAFVGAGAEVGAGTTLFPGVYIGENCHVGAGCVLYPNATLMAGTQLGDRTIVHAGAVLGSDGFGYAPGPNGLEKIPQVGIVGVGSDVEIGANTAIDRAALGVTAIGSGCKIDNLVQVGHNVEIGPHSIIVSQVGISGSTKVGKGVTMAGQVGVAGHLKIGDGATIGPKSGIAKDVPPGVTMGGIPAVDQGTYMRTLALMPKFPDMARRLNRLEKELSALKAALAQGDTE
ncbi:MAG: UDP-3-O-(3-hydroxymyristoyl)glucosamine N-acyltransferase [Desulfovibrionaceae bacterium]